MKVVVLIPGQLRQLTGNESRLEVDLAEPATLAALLDHLAARYPTLDRRLRDERSALRRYVNFFVDGEECRRLSGPDTGLTPDTEVHILPSVAGG
ncbi:MoaD/ThiS family protein [Saccharothrix xinjiangensis]|uniref:MoaD/ThiS family protein n=1 Tax=Saccharothrix xinjiangensis TaxID=204798 RepID=A0ABV9XUA3_9PSEU